MSSMCCARAHAVQHTSCTCGPSHVPTPALLVLMHDNYFRLEMIVNIKHTIIYSHASYNIRAVGIHAHAHAIIGKKEV